MSIADKITELTTIRGDIRTALAGKGVSASDHDYADFASDISSISGGVYPLIVQRNVNGVSTKIKDGEWVASPSSDTNMGRLVDADGVNFTINFSDSTDWRVIARFKINSLKSSGTHNIVSNSSIDYAAGVCLEVDANKFVAGGYSSEATPSSTNIWVFFQYPDFAIDTWYYICGRYYNGVLYISMYDDTGTLIQENHQTVSNIYNRAFNPQIGGLNASYFTMTDGEIDMKNVVYEKNGTVLWGALTPITQNLGKIEL